MKKTVYPCLFCFCAILTASSMSFSQEATVDEVALLKAELRILKTDYEQRIALLEARLQQLEQGEVVEVEIVEHEVVATEMDERVSQKVDEAVHDYLYTFDPVTESRSFAIRESDIALRERVESVLNDFVEITGYFRAGYGRNDAGGPQVGFQAPGAASKYRLGNEADTYGEISFVKNWYTGDSFSLDPLERLRVPDGPVVHFEMMLAYYNPVDDLLKASSTDVTIPQTWASIGNIIEGQPSAKFWAGNRYYRRHDIHVTDFFYYNMSGAGGGMEDWQLPIGKLAVAWIGQGSRSGISSAPGPDPDNEAGFSKQTWDLRWYDVAVPFGTAEFGFAYSNRSSGLDENGLKAKSADGFALNMVHTREGVLSDDGYNKFTLQYGRGPGMTFTSGFETFSLDGGNFIAPYTSDSWRFRVTEHFVGNVSDSFSISPVFVYEVTQIEDAGKRYWASAGVRPIIHFNDNVSLAFEAGYDWTKDELTGLSDSLLKLTIAPQLSLGGRFLSRPVLRAFVTYSTWGDDFVGQVGGADYADESEGFTTGVQFEAWW